MTDLRSRALAALAEPDHRAARRGRSATPAPGSRCSASPAWPATRSRSSRTPPRCTGTPASRRGCRCTSRGTSSTTTASSPRTPPTSGVRIGAINSNLFQDDDYRLGSLTHADPAVRRKAIDHHAQCVEVMRQTGSTDLKIWLPDGTNYPGQDDLRGRQDRLADSLQQIYAMLEPEPPAAARVQVLRAVLLRDGHPRLGHLAGALPRARRAGHRRPRHRPPRARAPTSSSSSCSCCAPAGSARSTSTRATTPTTT